MLSDSTCQSQRREIHNLLDSFKRQLQTQTEPRSGNHQAPQFSGMASSGDRYEKKYQNKPNKPHFKTASFDSKINQVSDKISKETGYIHGKIDTISKEYSDQMKMLRKQITKLESEKTRKEQEEKKIIDRDFEQLTESLKGLMRTAVAQPRPGPSNFNPPQPQHFPHYDGPPPPYQPYPPMASNPNIPYFPSPSQGFHPMPVPVGPVPLMGSSFSYNQPGPPNMPSYDTAQKVYQFSGKPGSESGKHFTRGSGHSNPRFDKPFQRESDCKPDSNPRKSYCSPHWKKFDNNNKEHGFKNESSNAAGGKPRFKMPAPGEQSGGDFNSNPKSAHPNQFKHYADRDRNKRQQQFGKNRPQNCDDGDDSDTSTHSHVSAKNSGKEGTSTYPHTAGKPCQSKPAPKKNPPTSTGKSDSSNLQTSQAKPVDVVSDNASATSHVPSKKKTQKKPPNKAAHQHDGKTSLNQNPQSSSSKNQNQNRDDGDDSDTSTHSHVSTKNSEKEGTSTHPHTAGKPRKSKPAPKKNPPASAGESDSSNLQTPQANRDDGDDSDTSTHSHVSTKNSEKEGTSTHPHTAGKPRKSKPAPKKNPPASAGESDSSNLQTPQANRDDGDDSDTSTHSHVSTKNSEKEGTSTHPHTAGKPRKAKPARKKNPPASTGESDSSNLQTPQAKPVDDVVSDNASETSHVPSQKKTQKKPPNKAAHQHDGKTSLNQNPQSSSSENQNQSMDMHKLQYPPRAEALKMGIDIFKPLDPPSTCLAKENGVPVSRLAHCLEDIYNFEMEFGTIQVIRF
ncbi:dentin sialophosphoprotein-like isoform X2 [Planococcus citri]|uniref:dentin sialophosphoprotein-like isoform X2 n=1 Tax=Planococcus citri TaxID=170843 RepID=UPI0031F786F0